jgi:hypothetical protein
MVRFLRPALLALVAGCGLGEYEKQMLDSQKRFERYRADDEFLGGFITVPQKALDKETTTPIANLAFRPPKGVSQAIAKDEPYGGWLYELSGPAGGPFYSVRFGVLTLKDLQSTKAEAKGALLVRLMPWVPDFDPKALKAVAVEHPECKAMPFEQARIDDPNGTSTLVNVGVSDKHAYAVVYRFSRKKGDAPRVVSHSLASFGLDAEADCRRRTAEGAKLKVPAKL